MGRTGVALVVVVAAAALALAVGTAHAHLCMWSPMQRADPAAPFTLARPGEHACYHKPAPCGGIPYNPSVAPTRLVAGQYVTLAFEQNLNHFDAQHPGFLDVSWAPGTEPASDAQFTTLHVWPDFNAMNMITVTNFSVTVQVPAGAATLGPAVFRVRYASNNPGEDDHGTTFHQCADVLLVAAADADGTEASTARAPAAAQAGAAVAVARAPVLPYFKRRSPGPSDGTAAPPAGCCTARQFTIRAQESGGYRSPARSTIYYDAVNGLLRIDTVSGAGTGQALWDGSFQTYLNFSGSEVGHLYNVNAGLCDERGNAYGPDPWNDWCFGAPNPAAANESQTFVETVTFGSGPTAQTAHVWQTGEFFFAVSAGSGSGSGRNGGGGCVPLLTTRPRAGFAVLYYDFVAGAPDPALFVPPAACHAQLQRRRASNDRGAAAAGPSKPLPRHVRTIRDQFVKPLPTTTTSKPSRP